MLSRSVVPNSLWPHQPQHARLLCPWGVSRQECWSGLPCPPPGDLPNPEIKPGLLLCRLILYWLNHQGSPRIWEWVACPFSRGYSWPRNWTRVSCITRRFFTTWATREAHWKLNKPKTIPICSGHKVTSYNWEKKEKYKYVNIQWNIKQNIWQRKSDHHSLVLCFQGSLEHSTLLFFIFR